MSVWRTAKIRDVTHRVTKGTTPTSIGRWFTDDGIAFVKVESITHDGRIDPKKIAFIDHETNQMLSRSILEADDLLFSIAGTIGRVARVSEDLLPANTNQALAIVRANQDLVDVGYLRYCLQAKEGLDHATSRIVQSVQANLSLTDLSDMDIPLPPLAIQRAVAEVLGALDDKIAANTELIRAADDLSRTVFESILLDPTSLPLSDTAEFVNGKAFTKDASGTGRVVIRIAELNSGLGGSTVYNDIDVADQHLARPGDLLFAWSGSLTLHRWFRDEGVINQHIFKVIPKDGYPTWCVNGLLTRKLDEFKGIAADKATTMGHIQRRHLDEPVDVPVPAQIERNDELMTSLWRRALAAEEESLGLVETRDALLPMLLSGEIRVRDAEHMAGDVV